MNSDVQSQLDSLQSFIDKLLLEHDFNQSPRNSLYHYTSWESLCGIMTNKNLWFTDYRHLNDPTEFQFSLKETVRILEELNSTFNKCDTWNYFLNIFLNMAPEFKIYIFSLCEKRDFMLMWRYYANNGPGLCIGFKKNYLIQGSKNPITLEDCVAEKVNNKIQQNYRN